MQGFDFVWLVIIIPLFTFIILKASEKKWEWYLRDPHNPDLQYESEEDNEEQPFWLRFLIVLALVAVVAFTSYAIGATDWTFTIPPPENLQA